MPRMSLIDRVGWFVAYRHANRVFNRFVAAANDARRVQQRVLAAKLARNADSDYGREHGFGSIRTYRDFIRQVPIQRYEDFQPYIERLKRGEFGALLGGGQKVLMFALTSGTTAEPKFIPVTKAFLNEYRRGWNAFGVKTLADHLGTFLRPIVQTTSPMDESRTEAGIPCGAITGLMAATQKRLVRKYYVTPACVGYIRDSTAKYYTIMRLAVPADVAFMITASPATQLSLARVADEHREALIRDIHDGTLREDLPIQTDIRHQLAPRLAPEPAAARRLERLVNEHDALLPKHYWELGFMANWTGGTMGLYLQEFGRYFGDVPVRDIGLLASEGRMSIPIEDNTPAGILEVTSSFFEFIPAEEIEHDNPTTLQAHELEVGREYFIVLTTSSGLCRYDVGDQVRVVDYFGQAPVIEFLNRGAHTSSLTGEKLTEHQVVLAMARITRRRGWRIDSFVLAPRWGQPPFYMLHVEARRPGSIPQVKELAHLFDAELKALNIEYRSKRESGRLGCVQMQFLPAGTLVELDRQISTQSQRGPSEQYKHQYLYTLPGQDEKLQAVLRSADAYGAARAKP